MSRACMREKMKTGGGDHGLQDVFYTITKKGYKTLCRSE